MNLHDLGEFGLIAHLSESLSSRAGVLLGIGDDAAVLESLPSPVVTCDCLVETVHFRRDWISPRQLGRKAITVNVSDVAAMGGRPVAAVVTLALGPDDDLAFVEELYRGFEDAASLYGLTIAGGDTARAPGGLMLNVTLLGAAPQPVLRSGAHAGDMLLVSGTLGDSAAGLALLQNPAVMVSEDVREYLLARHHDPRARLEEMHAALHVAPGAISAAIDLSDGLAGDAAHIAKRSRLSLEIDAESIPVSVECRAAASTLGVDALDWALRGGEDYELLWCVRPANATAVIEAVQHTTGTMVTAVGRCIPLEESAVLLVYSDGRRVAAPGAFEHF
jgi:thiamine-monophosphate kinase